jgi:uncharacterized membrane protein YgcG
MSIYTNYMNKINVAIFASIMTLGLLITTTVHSQIAYGGVWCKAACWAATGAGAIGCGSLCTTGAGCPVAAYLCGGILGGGASLCDSWCSDDLSPPPAPPTVPPTTPPTDPNQDPNCPVGTSCDPNAPITPPDPNQDPNCPVGTSCDPNAPTTEPTDPSNGDGSTDTGSGGSDSGGSDSGGSDGGGMGGIQRID